MPLLKTRGDGQGHFGYEIQKQMRPRHRIGDIMIKEVFAKLLYIQACGLIAGAAIIGFQPTALAQDRVPLNQIQMTQEDVDQKLAQASGMLYGRGTPDEQNDAFNAMLYLATQLFLPRENVAEAQYHLSHFYRRGITGHLNSDSERSFHWMQQSAYSGHGHAQLTLGDSYRFGNRLEPDPALAVKWYERGVKNSPDGHGTYAAFFVGMAYFYGMGDVPVNYKKAKSYFEIANGHPPAEFLMGLLFEKGLGTDRNFKKAAHHYKQAIDFPYGISGRDSDLEYRGGSIKAGAKYRLAYLHKNGTGVEQDADKFVELIQSAAKSGIVDAQRDVGTLYRNGYAPLEKNMPEALRYYRMAAEGGDAKAAYFLGDIYLFGKGVKASSGDAIKYLSQSANTPYGFAQMRLGEIYETGEGGVFVNSDKALHWYKEAVNTGYPSAKDKLNKLQSKIKKPQRPAPKTAPPFRATSSSRYSPNELSAGEVFTGLAIIAGLVVAHNAMKEPKGTTSSQTDKSTPIGVSNCVQTVRNSFYMCQSVSDISNCTMTGCPDYWECGKYSLQYKNGKDKRRFHGSARKFGKCFRPSNFSAGDFVSDEFCDPATGKKSDNIYRLINKVCTP